VVLAKSIFQELISLAPRKSLGWCRDTQTHRHTDTQTHRHTDTQTHRHTDTQTHRHTDTQNCSLLLSREQQQSYTAIRCPRQCNDNWKRFVCACLRQNSHCWVAPKEAASLRTKAQVATCRPGRAAGQRVLSRSDHRPGLDPQGCLPGQANMPAVFGRTDGQPVGTDSLMLVICPAGRGATRRRTHETRMRFIFQDSRNGRRPAQLFEIHAPRVGDGREFLVGRWSFGQLFHGHARNLTDWHQKP
jgi:hypothetical protein